MFDSIKSVFEAVIDKTDLKDTANLGMVLITGIVICKTIAKYAVPAEECSGQIN